MATANLADSTFTTFLASASADEAETNWEIYLNALVANHHDFMAKLDHNYKVASGRKPTVKMFDLAADAKSTNRKVADFIVERYLTTIQNKFPINPTTPESLRALSVALDSDFVTADAYHTGLEALVKSTTNVPLATPEVDAFVSTDLAKNYSAIAWKSHSKDHELTLATTDVYTKHPPVRRGTPSTHNVSDVVTKATGFVGFAIPTALTVFL